MEIGDVVTVRVTFNKSSLMEYVQYIPCIILSNFGNYDIDKNDLVLYYTTCSNLRKLTYDKDSLSDFAHRIQAFNNIISHDTPSRCLIMMGDFKVWLMFRTTSAKYI